MLKFKTKYFKKLFISTTILVFLSFLAELQSRAGDIK